MMISDNLKKKKNSRMDNQKAEAAVPREKKVHRTGLPLPCS